MQEARVTSTSDGSDFDPWTVLAIVAASIATSIPILLRGPSAGDDLELHLSYLAAIVRNIEHGSWYPTWLPYLNKGGGSPAFLVQYPLPYGVMLVLYVPFRLIFGHDLNSFAPAFSLAAVILFLAISGLTCFWWLRSFASKHASLLGAVAYVLAPYHSSIDAYRRFAVGEMMSFAVLPLLLLFARR